MRSRILPLLILALGAAGAAEAQPGQPIRVRTIATERFGRRVVPQATVAQDAEIIARLNPRVRLGPVPPTPSLPGTELAVVGPQSLKVDGKLEALGFGVLLATLGGRFYMLPSDILVPPPPPEPSPLPISTHPHLRLVVEATEGAFYIISCRVSPGTYRVRQGLMVETSAPEITRSADSSGDLIFHLDNAAAGRNVFSIHSTSLWTWESCRVNQLS
jgi:hypothetical protein